MADNVIKKVIDMRKGKTAILPSIVTNPELTGEEESLKSVGINGTNFTIGGGNGQLKLVAEVSGDDCEYEEYHAWVSFTFNKKLTTDKFYLLEVEDTSWVYYNILNMYDNKVLCTTTNANDDSPIPISIVDKAVDTEKNTTTLTIISDNDEPILNLIAVRLYELPLTFNEEPKVDNKMKLVATGTYDKDSSNETSLFIQLDNSIENNKLYFIYIIDNYLNYEYSLVFNNSVSINFRNVDNEDDFIPCIISMISTNELVINSYETSICGEYSDVEVKVYELPYEFEI